MKAELVSGQFLTSSLLSEDSCRTLFAILGSIDQKIMPTRYGHTEPPRKPFSLDAIASDWDGSIIWKRNKPTSEGNFWPSDHFRPLDTIYLDVADLSRADTLVAIQDGWANCFGTMFGYVHVVADAHAALPEYPARIMPFSRGLAWRGLDSPLPCLAWSVFFGPDYVKRIGRERLLAAPVFRTRESKAGIRLQLSESVQQLLDNYAAYRKVRDTLAQYLGHDVVAQP